MNPDDDQELQWITFINGEQTPMTNNSMDTVEDGTVPNGNHISLQFADLNQRDITGVTAKSLELNSAAQRQQQQQQQQQRLSQKVRHIIFKSNNGNAIMQSNYALAAKQQKRQQQSQFGDNVGTKTHKGAPKITRVSVNSNSAANTITALSALSNNRFSLLDIDVPITDSQTNMHSNSSAHYKKNNNASDGTNTRDGTLHDSSSTEDEDETQRLELKDDTKEHSQRFLPPIVLYDVNIRAFIIELRTKIPDLIFKIKNCTNRKSKLFIKDYQAYTKIMSILKEKGINSHSYTPLQDKHISLVLRGIHYSTSPEEIKAELDELLPNSIENVSALITPHMKKNKIKSSLFRVTLRTGNDSRDLLNIKYILSQSITWEKPKSFANQMQCKRCQRWGHIANNCNHPFQCVKCDEEHGPSECKLIKTTETKPYCTNCKQWGHPANFRGCEAYKAFVIHKLSKNNMASTGVEKATSSHTQFTGTSFTPKKSAVRPNISYASHLRAHNMSESTPLRNANLIEDFLQIANQLLKDDPPPLEVQIEYFLKNFKTMSPEVKKAECRKILDQLN